MAHVRIIHWDEARRLFSRALAAGAKRLGFTTCEWDVAGSCETPYLRVSLGRPHTTGQRTYTVTRSSRTPLEVRMWLPCSRCAKCRARLAYGWRKRAEAELDMSSRTWFGTLTFKPSERYRLLARASAAYGPGFDGLPEHHRFRLIEREGYQEAQKYWKRVRKETGRKLRYIMVAEAHSDGSLHYHALVHERGGNEIRHSTLTRQWVHGFTKWKLVDRGRHVARYVTKYLTKSNATRTRASVRYGYFALTAGGNEVTQRGITSVRGTRPPQTKKASGEADGTRGGVGNFLGRGTDPIGDMKDGTSLSSGDRAWLDYQAPGASLSHGTRGNTSPQALSNRDWGVARGSPG